MTDVTDSVSSDGDGGAVASAVAHLRKPWHTRPVRQPNNDTQPITPVGPVGHGVYEYRQGSRRIMRGGSGFAHFYNPYDEASRLCAIYLARSRWKRLGPRGIWPVMVGDQLGIAVRNKTFVVEDDKYITSFDETRAKAIAYLEQCRSGAPAANTESIAQENKVNNESPTSVQSENR